jgi:hypothetical protein
MVHPKTIRRTRSLAAPFVLALASFAAFVSQGAINEAHAIAAPTSFTVAQTPNAATVQPEDVVTYDLDFTSNAATPVLAGLVLAGNLGPNLVVTSFTGGLGPTFCAGVGTQSFTCTLPSLGANTPIATITVNAKIRNVADGSSTNLAPAAFTARDGGGDGTPANPSTDPGALTVQNESVAATNAGSLPAVFEAGTLNFTTTFTNNGSGNSGSYNSVMTIAGGLVANVVCPGGAPGSGSGSTTATCSINASLAASGGSGVMIVTAQAANGAVSISSSVTLSPGAGNTTGTPAGILYVPPPLASASVSELNLSGPSSGTTNTPVTVCTTNNPVTASLIAGASSGLNPLTVADYQLVAAGGAAPSGQALGNCPVGQQGVAFTSTTAGTVTVTAVTNGVQGLSNSIAVAFSASPANNPIPTLSAIAPTSIGAGSPGFSLVVTGANFVAGSIVRWNGSDLATTYGSPISLSATVPAGNVASGGSATITVFNPAPGGGTSGSQPLQITSAPVLSSLAPTTAPAGGAGFTLVVGGSSFVPGAMVRWNGVDLTTTFSTSAALSASVPAGNIASPGTIPITVFNPGAGGGLSNAMNFSVTQTATKLAFTAQPGDGAAGSALSVQPVVAVKDAGNTTITSDNATSVTLALNGAGTLTCTGGLTKTVSAGVATFAGCAVSAPATGLTITATSSPVLTPATSTTFAVVAGAPTSSAQLVVARPGAGNFFARSRLTFSVATGSLSPNAVNFIIKRKSDNKYWNETTGAWEANLVQNAGVAGSAAGTFVLAITSNDRRDFVGTTVTVEVRGTAGGTVYVNGTIPEIGIR